MCQCSFANTATCTNFVNDVYFWYKVAMRLYICSFRLQHLDWCIKTSGVKFTKLLCSSYWIASKNVLYMCCICARIDMNIVFCLISVLDREGMICIALLCGSDYTEGVEGIGPVSAMELMGEFGGTDFDTLKKFKWVCHDFLLRKLESFIIYDLEVWLVDTSSLLKSPWVTGGPF